MQQQTNPNVMQNVPNVLRQQHQTPVHKIIVKHKSRELSGSQKAFYIINTRKTL